MNLLHWAENLYQKLEKACTESEVVQVPCGYVDAVSDRIKHVLDEITDYVYPYDDLSDRPDSSGEPDSSTVSEGCTEGVHEPDSLDVSEGCTEGIHEPDSLDVSEGCTEGIHESDSSDVSEGCTSSRELEPDSSDVSEDYTESTVESNLSSMQDERFSQNIHEPEPDSSVVSGDYMESTVESRSQNIQGTYPYVSSSEVLSLPTSSDIKSTSALGSGLKFPDSTEEGTEEDSNIPESVNTCDLSLVTSSGPEQELRSGLKFPDSTEEDSNIPESVNTCDLSLVTSSGPKQELSRQIICDESADVTENCMSQETVSLLRSLTDEVDAPERLSETVMEILDDNYMEDVFTTIDTLTPIRVLMDSFEDVNLNTCWEDAENFELVVTPNHVYKESPEKMKLRYAFISKVLAAKRNKKVKNQSGVTQSCVTDIEINAQLSNSTGDSCGSDWVLL